MPYPNGFLFESKHQLDIAVSAAYQDALAFARKDLGRGSFQSRGKSIVGLNAMGDLCYGEAESSMWDGSAKDLLVSIERAKAAGAVLVAVQGGVNYANSPHDFADCNYDPWVAEWAVNAWRDPNHKEI